MATTTRSRRGSSIGASSSANLVLAMSCDLARPGDILTHHATGVPIALVRARTGRAHAFLNVCRHRGAKVIQGFGYGRHTFACPYHAWTYDCEGRLLGMGTTRGFEGVSRAGYGLTELPVAEREQPDTRSSSSLEAPPAELAVRGCSGCPDARVHSALQG